MHLVNRTKAVAGWTMGFDRDGRELVVVTIKATFAFPRDQSEPQLADEQVALTEADEFTGEPGLSAPTYEADYAHRKPMCDVLLNGCAYAPPGSMVRQTTVGIRVGAMTKIFTVVGHRTWRKGAFGLSITDPEPFDVMPISYNTAFGGDQFLANPVGRGHMRSKQGIDGCPLPNTEELDKPVIDPGGAYRPMSLGPIGRNWLPRFRHAGTSDQRWLDDRAPFWPDDFSYAYFQAAPPDQQIPYPVGGEQVVLRNLTPDGNVTFRLPSMAMPVWFVSGDLRDTRVDAAIDTVSIEPDLGRFSLAWRAAIPMRRSCFDLEQVIVGETSKAWQRSRKYGTKPYLQGAGRAGPRDASGRLIGAVMPGIAITAAGMVTAVGFNAPATCAALRAGVRNVKRTNLWDPETGTYLAAGKVALPQWWPGLGKLADLIAPAIKECFDAAAPVPPQEIPVLLGVASPDHPFRERDLDSDIFAEIEHRLGFLLHPASRVVPAGHVSAGLALRHASILLARREVPRVVVAAVDSLLEHDLKNYFLEKSRLLTPENSNGFSLGEAGAAVLVGPVGAEPVVSSKSTVSAWRRRSRPSIQRNRCGPRA